MTVTTSTSPTHIVVLVPTPTYYLVRDTNDLPCGLFHVNFNSSTVFAPRKATTNDVIAVVGSGSCHTSMTATSITVATSTPSPSPSATPTATPVPTHTPAPTATPVPTAAPAPGGAVNAFQIFDEFHYTIPNSAKVTDGSRYSVVWGATAPSDWRAHSNVLASYYIPQTTDFNSSMWGGIGHSLAWWQANHPDWVLYSCDSHGTPTTQVTTVGGWGGQVPLDFHNLAVVEYQANTAAAYARSQGYNAIAVDETVLFNAAYNSSTGMHSCGIYSNGQFVQRYSTNIDDPNYATDVINWVKTVRSIFAANGLKLVVNTPHGTLGPGAIDAGIVGNTDYDLDETGFEDYGRYTTNEALLAQTLSWTVAAQKMGTGVLSNAQFSGTSSLAPAQREYAIGTYLLANEGRLSIYAGPSNDYGGEMYYSEYSRSYGSPCADATQVGTVFTRRLANAFVAVNGSAAPASVALPAGHYYTDLEGRSVSNPLLLGSHDSFVLLTTGGCQ